MQHPLYLEKIEPNKVNQSLQLITEVNWCFLRGLLRLFTAAAAAAAVKKKKQQQQQKQTYKQRTEKKHLTVDLGRVRMFLTG